MAKRAVEEVAELSKRLGRVPTVVELKANISPKDLAELKTEYGSFSNLIDDLKNPGKSGDGILHEARALKKFKSICSRKEQIQGFFRHVLDLDELFRRAGNPPTLKVLAQPDTHAKFVHRPSFDAFVKYMKWYQPHVHIIMGDFADCEGLAHWEQSTLEPRRIVPEMKIARALLKELVDAQDPNCVKIFLEGNHEYWIQMALTRMPELFDGLEDLGIEISVKTLLALDKFGFELFPLNHLIKIGKAHFTHGLFTGQNHAKKHLDTLKGNVYYGHLHDTQSHNQTSLDGHMEAASLACLCRLDAQFLKGRPNNWVNGFGQFEFFPDGNYTFVRPTMFEGRFSMCGIVFDGNTEE